MARPRLTNRTCKDCGKGPLGPGLIVKDRCRTCNSNYRWHLLHPAAKKNRTCSKCGKRRLRARELVEGLCRSCYGRELAAHPGPKVVEGPPLPGSEGWLAEWLARQVESFVKTKVPYFSKNGTRFYAVTEEQLIELLKLGYMFKYRNTHEEWSQHQAVGDKIGGYQSTDDCYLDRPVSPDITKHRQIVRETE